MKVKSNVSRNLRKYKILLMKESKMLTVRQVVKSELWLLLKLLMTKKWFSSQDKSLSRLKQKWITQVRLKSILSVKAALLITQNNSGFVMDKFYPQLLCFKGNRKDLYGKTIFHSSESSNFILNMTAEKYNKIASKVLLYFRILVSLFAIPSEITYKTGYYLYKLRSCNLRCSRNDNRFDCHT